MVIDSDGGALGGGPGTQVAVRRRVGEGTGSRAVGPEREVPGAVPGRPGDHEQQSDLVAAARLCVRDAAGGRVRRRAAPSPPGAGERQAAVVAPAGREHAAGDGRATGGQQPAPDTAGGDRHPAGAVEHRLRAELQSGSGVRLVVALPVISAVLRGPAARLLFRHRAGHWAGIRGGRRGRGRAMGLGESRVGRRLRERQRQPIQQHQRQSVADHLKPLGRGRWEWAARQFRPRARRTGGPSRPFASLRTGQCGAASDTPGGVGGAGGVAPVVGGAVVGRPGGVGGVGGAGRPGGVGGVGGRWPAAWWSRAASAALGGRAVRAASVGVGRPGGPGGAGGAGGASRPTPAAGWRRPALRPARSVRAAHLAT